MKTMTRARFVLLFAAASLASGATAPAGVTPIVEHHRAVDVWYGTLTVRDAAGGVASTRDLLQVDRSISAGVRLGVVRDAAADGRAKSADLLTFVDASLADIDWALDASGGADARSALVSAVSAAAIALGNGTLVLGTPKDRGTSAHTITTWSTSIGPTATAHAGIADVSYHELDSTFVPNAAAGGLTIEHHRAVNVWYGTLTVRRVDGSILSTEDFLRSDTAVASGLVGKVVYDGAADPRAKTLAPVVDGVIDDADWAQAAPATTDARASLDAAFTAVGPRIGSLVVNAAATRGVRSYDFVHWSDPVGQPRLDHVGFADVAYHERNATYYTGLTFFGRPLPVDTVVSHFLPKTVKVALNAKTPRRSTLTASGVLDTGPYPPTFGAAATLLVGDLSFAGPRLDVQANGAYRWLDESVDFTVTPPTSGSSRATFTLKVTGDFRGKIDMDGPLELRFIQGAVDAAATVALRKGRFAFGKVRGSLTSPSLWFDVLKAKLRVGGDDRFTVRIGLGSLGATPEKAPDIQVQFGTALGRTLTGDEFTKRGDSFVRARPAGGISRVVFDYARGTLTMSEYHTETDLIEGAQSLLVAVSVGGETRAALVRVVRSGKAWRY